MIGKRPGAKAITRTVDGWMFSDFSCQDSLLDAKMSASFAFRNTKKRPGTPSVARNEAVGAR